MAGGFFKYSPPGFNRTELTPHQSPAVTASPAVIVIRSLRFRDNLAWVLLTKSKIWTTPHQGEAFALRVTYNPSFVTFPDRKAFLRREQAPALP